MKVVGGYYQVGLPLGFINTMLSTAG